MEELQHTSKKLDNICIPWVHSGVVNDTASYPHLVFEYFNSNLICTLEYFVGLSLKLDKKNLHICSLGYRYTHGRLNSIIVPGKAEH